ncbi:pyridoxamine 5'-phosphate oxidase family protein [Geodermatophilus sp. SYSU D00079]
MRTPSHVLRDLDVWECRALLGTATLGRLAFTQNALPMILPGHFRIRGAEVVVAILAPSSIASARNEHVVVFEVDTYDEATREGWSVSVIGPSRLVVDAEEIAELDGLDFSPSSSAQGWHYVAVDMGVLRGTRLARTAPEVVSRSTDVTR